MGGTGGFQGLVGSEKQSSSDWLLALARPHRLADIAAASICGHVRSLGVANLAGRIGWRVMPSRRALS